MQAKLLPPRNDYLGNLLWNAAELAGREKQLSISLSQLRKLGYWASPFPERDGVAFKSEDRSRDEVEISRDFANAFQWLNIEVAHSKDANTELVGLVGDAPIDCVVVVPLTRMFIEESFSLGGFHFVCQRQLDDRRHDRLGDFDGEYLQFKTSLMQSHLLRVDRALTHNDLVINKCLALAEHALDVIRYQFSSFLRPEFTPNPAGQLDDGTYAVEIIPEGNTHLKAISLRGISRPMSASNNWLGPEVSAVHVAGQELLVEILQGRTDDLAASVRAALRGCRQSFYALGDESKFLNLVFTLDGLAHPERSWQGWKHRTYLAALISHGNVMRFGAVLERYDNLYTGLRNTLVHGGKDFHEVSEDAAQACQDVYDYVKEVIKLIETENFTTLDQLRTFATEILRHPPILAAYTNAIQKKSAERNTSPRIPAW